MTHYDSHDAQLRYLRAHIVHHRQKYDGCDPTPYQQRQWVRAAQERFPVVRAPERERTIG